MRRPAPLPASGEKEPAATRATAPRPAERDAEAEIVDLRVGAVAAEHDAEPEPATTRDVWRAARARRKALRAEIRRFTQRSRRRRLLWLAAVGALVVLVGGSVAAAYSPLFAVEKVTVLGTTTLDPATVEAALGDQIGTPLALIDTSEVKAALLAFPLIETYALEARPPHDLTVRIVERTPVGVIRSDAGYTLVDAAGVALATTTDQPAGQPLIEVDGGTDSAAFESAGLVVRSVTADIRAQLTGVRASTADDVTLTLSSGLTVVWGNAEQSALKAELLAKTMLARPDASSIDVTSPRIAVVG